MEWLHRLQPDSAGIAAAVRSHADRRSPRPRRASAITRFGHIGSIMPVHFMTLSDRRQSILRACLSSSISSGIMSSHFGHVIGFPVWTSIQAQWTGCVQRLPRPTDSVEHNLNKWPTKSSHRLFPAECTVCVTQELTFKSDRFKSLTSASDSPSRKKLPGCSSASIAPCRIKQTRQRSERSCINKRRPSTQTIEIFRCSISASLTI